MFADSDMPADELRNGTFVAILMEDEQQFYITEIIKCGEGDQRYKVAFLKRLKRVGGSKDKYWGFPTIEDVDIIHRNSILDIFPIMDINMKMSNSRIIVMEVLKFIFLKSRIFTTIQSQNMVMV